MRESRAFGRTSESLALCLDAEWFPALGDLILSVSLLWNTLDIGGKHTREEQIDVYHFGELSWSPLRWTAGLTLVQY